MLDLDENVMALLANLDDDTFAHCKRTSDLSFALGQKMGLSTTELQTLTMGALLHDIGKSRVPPAVLQKTTQLTSQEWELIKQHPVDGYNLIKSLALPDALTNIILEHHRWADGMGGYPANLNPAKPSFMAQIVAVADVVDAMTHPRPYRPAHSISYCSYFMESRAGSQFNCDVVNTLLEYLDKGGPRRTIAN